MSFANDFSISHSALRDFDACPRRWWWKKIGSWKGWEPAAPSAWKGWEPAAPSAARMAYRLKQMKDIYMLAGDVVHQVAARAILGPGHLDRDGALEMYDRMMRQAYREAIQQARLTEFPRPKEATNLRELYYENAVRDLDGFVSRAFQSGQVATGNIFDSEPYIDCSAGAFVEEAEKLRKFRFGPADSRFTVWAKVDLAYNTNDLIWIWDWKTGRPKSIDGEQMLLYALYALSQDRQDMRGAPLPRLARSLGQIRLGIAYLKTGDSLVIDPSEPAWKKKAEAVFRKLEDGAEEIRSRLPDPDLNEAPMAAFERTEDPETCRDCMLFHVCRGHRDLSRPDHNEPGYEE